MKMSAHRIVVLLLVALQLGMSTSMLLSMGVAWAGSEQNHLYPDMFPYVDQNSSNTLQNWDITGSNTLDLRTIFGNQGDGLFEIRRGAAVPGNPNRDRLLQRVYINNDFGNEYEDIDIGTTPRPTAISGNLPDGRPGGNEAPFPSGAIGTENLIWIEDFTRFSLLEAVPMGNGYAVGAEVAGNTKAGFAVQATSQLPGTTGSPIESPSNFFQNRISSGWGDLYIANDPGNEIDITGVDRSSLYWLRQTVDPENRFAETDETNNSFEVLIDLSRDRSGAMLNNDGSFVQPVPEPGTLAYLTCLTGASLILSRRRRRDRRDV